MAKIEKEQIISELETLKSEGEVVRSTTHSGGFSGTFPVINSGTFNAWRAKILTMMDNRRINAPEIRAHINKEGCEYPKHIDSIQAQLDALIDSINKGYVDDNNVAQFDSILELENIFNKFHGIVRHLRARYNNRETLNVNDEYDVQDLLSALLKLHFDDVRPEEWTPSYAGGAVRMDFLLKDCSTVIEVKKTRKSMTAKDLGEQLIIDREKYKSHPDCKTLYCFVYDPDGFLRNPVGIKRDLEAGNEGFLKVIIRPE